MLNNTIHMNCII